MKSPIIHTGKPFDWDRGNEAVEHLANDDGSVNWRAAFSADPGVMSCPNCAVHLWREGTDVECPECGHRWTVENRP
jgi:predicted RNA-binding Zn-ribbon protein involved in translation (DUF1610 family)